MKQLWKNIKNSKGGKICDITRKNKYEKNKKIKFKYKFIILSKLIIDDILFAYIYMVMKNLFKKSEETKN